MAERDRDARAGYGAAASHGAAALGLAVGLIAAGPAAAQTTTPRQGAPLPANIAPLATRPSLVTPAADTQRPTAARPTTPTAAATATGTAAGKSSPNFLNAPLPANAARAVEVLVQQATYWRAQYQPDKAIAALNRALRLEPNNVAALALMVEVQADQGDRAGGEATLSRLRAIAPSDPRLARLKSDLAAAQIDTSALFLARALAQKGHPNQAIAAYQRLFHGTTPPDRFAVEYYQTLAGTKTGWEQARAGLAQMVITDPSDLRAQLAYAQVLTYKQETRLEGIQRLYRLVENPPVAVVAQSALRQALMWLPLVPDSIPPLQAYVRSHPHDVQMTQRLEQAKNPPTSPADRLGQLRKTAFDELNANRLDAAEQSFQQVLATQPNDPDSLGGMGIIRLKQGRLPEAEALLEQAIKLDPAHAKNWEPALAGARRAQNLAAGFARVRALVQHQQFDQARDLLTRLTGKNPNAGMLMLIASAESQAGQLAAAERDYRTVIGLSPRNGPALAGLAGLLAREGRDGEADVFFTRAEQAGAGRLVAAARSQALRERAAATTDPNERMGLLRAAVVLEPTDPWLRLSLAQAMVAVGQRGAAEQMMLQAAEGRGATQTNVQAALIFAQQQNNNAMAESLIARIPPHLRTAQMRELVAQARARADVAAAVQLYHVNAPAGIQRLLALSAAPDSTGLRGVGAAKALLAAHDAADAQQAITAAIAANPSAGPDALLAYAGFLLQMGQMAQAQSLVARIQTRHLTPQQAEQAMNIRAGIAVRASDILNAKGERAAAWDQLAPVLRRDPTNTAANLALARLYQSAGHPDQALRIVRAQMVQHPKNLEVRRAAVDAAIAAGNWRTAETLAKDATRTQPQSIDSWLIAADVAKARGDTGGALRALEHARELRARALGLDDPGYPVPTSMAASPDPTAQASLFQPGKFAAPRIHGSDGTLPSGDPPFPVANAAATTTHPAGGGPLVRLTDAEGFADPASRDTAMTTPQVPRSLPLITPAEAATTGSNPADRPATGSAFPAESDAGNPDSGVGTVYTGPGDGGVGTGMTHDDDSAPPSPEATRAQATTAPTEAAPPTPLLPAAPGGLPSLPPAQSSPAQYPIVDTAMPVPPQPPADLLPQLQAAPPVTRYVAPAQQRYAAPRRYAPFSAPPSDLVPIPQPAIAPTPELRNPFSNPIEPLATAQNVPETLPQVATAPSDPVMQHIDQQIAQLQRRSAPEATASVSLRQRSGTAGVDQLTELMAPVEARFTPGGGPAQITLLATPTYLNAGSISSTPQTLASIGTLPLYNLSPSTPMPGTSTGQGLGLDGAFQWRWIKVDAGTSPLGLPITNIVGGITLTPSLGPHSTLRMTVDRRSVTDSLLSYGGITDPSTGQLYGGVYRDRAHAQLEFSVGKANMYVGGGYAMFHGTNVASNNEIEMGAGGSIPIWQDESNEVRLGIDLVYFGFDRNLRFFTLGQGGYFSPQSYFASLFPVTWTGKDGPLHWTLGATMGWELFHENSSPVFPTSPTLQGRLVSASYNNPLIVAVQPARSESGFSGSLRGSVEYEVAKQLRVGAAASIQKSGSWTESLGQVYARYLFNGDNNGGQ